MPRITSKGQVTIPKKIRDQFHIKPSDLGEFMVKEGQIILKIKKGTILDAHRESIQEKIRFKDLRKKMEKEIADQIIQETK